MVPDFWAKANGSGRRGRQHAWANGKHACESHPTPGPIRMAIPTSPCGACLVSIGHKVPVARSHLSAPDTTVRVGMKRRLRIKAWAKANGIGYSEAKAIIFQTGMRSLLPVDGPDSPIPEWTGRKKS